MFNEYVVITSTIGKNDTHRLDSCSLPGEGAMDEKIIRLVAIRFNMCVLCTSFFA